MLELTKLLLKLQTDESLIEEAEEQGQEQQQRQIDGCCEEEVDACEEGQACCVFQTTI